MRTRHDCDGGAKLAHIVQAAAVRTTLFIQNHLGDFIVDELFENTFGFLGFFLGNADRS